MGAIEQEAHLELRLDIAENFRESIAPAAVPDVLGGRKRHEMAVLRICRFLAGISSSTCPASARGHLAEQQPAIPTGAFLQTSSVRSLSGARPASVTSCGFSQPRPPLVSHNIVHQHRRTWRCDMARNSDLDSGSKLRHESEQVERRNPLTPHDRKLHVGMWQIGFAIAAATATVLDSASGRDIYIMTLIGLQGL